MNTKFYLNPSFTLLNHGSFGVAGKEPFELRIKLIKQMESQPDVWFRQGITTMWKENLQVVCDFLGSKNENLVFVNNTTTGVNCVLRSLDWKIGDGILYNSWTYGAVTNTLKYLEHSRGITLYGVPFPYPMKSSDQIIEMYTDFLKKHHNVKLVILDAISSMPPSLMPLNKLIDLCRRFEKLILVDGAHAPGQLSLNLETLGCHFFAGNLHKWCYAPRGCAVLWVDPEFHQNIFPSVISRFNTNGDLSDMFFYQGTSDDSTFYCSGKSIAFFNELGGHIDISKYCSNLVKQGANLLVEKWNTEHFPLPSDMAAPFMRMVALPRIKKYPLPETDGIKIFVRDMSQMMQDFWERFKIQCCFVSLQNKPWVRLSANVYNSMEDFHKLADSMLLLVREDETSG